MSTVTVSLPDPLAERLDREARRQSVTPDVIVRKALEQALAQEEGAGERSVFERLQSLSVNDPASPTDLATNPAHMEGFGVSRSALVFTLDEDFRIYRKNRTESIEAIAPFA